MVDYRYVTGRLMQMPAYHDAILKACGQSRWLALIDLDEFLVPVQQDSVPDFLRDYEQYYGVAVNWVNFDCNGHAQRPTAHGGLVTANYTRTVRDHNRFERDRMFKCIVDPLRVASVIDGHRFLYKSNCINALTATVTEDCKPLPSLVWHSAVHTATRMRINHYFTKSSSELELKKQRGSPNIQALALYNNRDLYASAAFPAELETMQDTLIIDKYLPRLKAALGMPAVSAEAL